MKQEEERKGKERERWSKIKDAQERKGGRMQ